MKKALFVGILYLSALTVCSAPLAVDNRTAQSDEWGYHPADGSTADMNPPSFTWIHDKRAAAYDVQWARTADFANASSATHIPWCVYTHNAPLAVGTWYWRYRFITSKKDTSGWSVTRSVTVPTNAVLFPMPSRAEQRKRLPNAHPRLFMRPDDLPRLRAAATTPGPASELFKEMRKTADQLIVAGPTPEPKVRGSAKNKDDDVAVQSWWPNREISDRAGGEAETLAFVWLLAPEPKYGQQF